jgi:hypothetical protein
MDEIAAEIEEQIRANSRSNNQTIFILPYGRLQKKYCIKYQNNLLETVYVSLPKRFENIIRAEGQGIEKN